MADMLNDITRCSANYCSVSGICARHMRTGIPPGPHSSYANFSSYPCRYFIPTQNEIDVLRNRISELESKLAECDRCEDDGK